VGILEKLVREDKISQDSMWIQLSENEEAEYSAEISALKEKEIITEFPPFEGKGRKIIRQKKLRVSLFKLWLETQKR